MALDESKLAQELEAAVDAIAAGKDPKVYKKNYYLALATTIIAHIKANAVVNGGVCTQAGPISGGKVT